jgi:hypothetical protein
MLAAGCLQTRSMAVPTRAATRSLEEISLGVGAGLDSYGVSETETVAVKF